jgi:PilZ domain
MLTRELVEHLADFKIARVSLPTRTGGVLVLDGAIRVLPSGELEGRFLPGQLPVAELAQGARGRLACGFGLNVLVIHASVIRVVDERSVRLLIEETTSHGDPRRHFRVNTELELRYWPAGGERPVQAEATRVNLSGGGLRFTIIEPFRVGQRLALELTLPGLLPRQIHCQGQIVSIGQSAQQRREAAVHLVDIQPADLDRLLVFCLGAKLQELQSKAQFLGSILDPRQ